MKSILYLDDKKNEKHFNRVQLVLESLWVYLAEAPALIDRVEGAWPEQLGALLAAKSGPRRVKG